MVSHGQLEFSDLNRGHCLITEHPLISATKILQQELYSCMLCLYSSPWWSSLSRIIMVYVQCSISYIIILMRRNVVYLISYGIEIFASLDSFHKTLYIQTQTFPISVS